MNFSSFHLMDIPHSHKTDDETGWYYQDDPYGGFLVYEWGECHTVHDDREVTVPFGVTVEFIDMESATGDDGFMVNANLTPHPDVLSAEKREKVAGRWDDDGEPIVDIQDVAMYGLCVPLASEIGDTWEDGFEKIEGELAFGGTMPGWVLDRPWNMIGTTGWDVIADAAFDENAHEKSLARLRERLDMEKAA